MSRIERALQCLCIGSRWQKTISKKRYEVIGFAIDSRTSEALVVYSKIDDAGDAWGSDDCARPISEWLGDQLVPGSDPKKYVPRFQPIEEPETP